MDRDDHYERLLREARERESALRKQLDAQPLPPPPKTPSLAPKSHLAWAGVVAAIVASLGGGAGIAEVVRAKSDTDTSRLEALVSDMAQDLKTVRGDTGEVRDFVRTYVSQQELRSDIIAGVLCRQNGDKPFARDVDCDAVGFEIPPIGKTTIRSTTPWPRVDRAP